jgi:uncharacterized DUF497 family protein
VDFDWDDDKAASNLRKHGIVGEQRFRTTGVVRGIGLLVVIHTVDNEGRDDELIRMISARRPEPHERKAYENG